MTTIFNVNEYTNINDPYPQIKWKGPTVSQVSAGVRLNKLTRPTDIANNIITGRRLFKALPLKIYRREIATLHVKCTPRTSLKIKDFDMPGGTIISNYSTVGTTRTGLVNTTEILYENNSCQHPSTDSVNKARCNVFLSIEANALRRVRSSGMIKRNFNTAANNDTYYTSTAQYLNSRNLSFQQNQYFHIRTGDASVKPGTKTAVQNIYQANGINHCSKFKINAATTFQYRWIDGNNYTVTVPIGSYDVSDFNTILHTTMYTNNHYYVLLPAKTPVYLLNFIYDNISQRLSIESFPANTTIYQIGVKYDYPYVSPAVPWIASVPTAPTCKNASIIISSGSIEVALGIVAGTYPSASNNTTYQLNTGSPRPGIMSNYLPIYYKPNNPQFGRQGAVSSGDLITRKKYDTITTVSSSFRSAFGNQTADALAYGVSDYGYTLKDKVGYPLKQTPKFSKYSTIMRKCPVRKFSRAI
jgi:hypothetical protein